MTSKRWMPGRFTTNGAWNNSDNSICYSNVDADKGSEVLQMMPPNVQEQVVERVGAMETTPMDQIEACSKYPWE